MCVNECCITGSGTDVVDENETPKENTLDMASTLDSQVNGSVTNGTIHTIPKIIEKTDECSNGENSLLYSLRYAAPFDMSTNLLSRQGFQRVPNECPALNKHYPGSTGSNLDYTKPPILQGAAEPTARDEKFTTLQHKNYSFAPLHVECDPVSNSVIK